MFSLMASGEDNRPILKESPARLLRVMEGLGRDTVAAARVNVAHDVARKRLRVFSITPQIKSEDFKEFGYDLEIVYNEEMAALGGPASYHFQHNNFILAFAAAQFEAGNKAFAKRLVAILAEAEPDLGWSSPTDPMITIKQIITGLEKNDDTVKPFLKDWSQEWTNSLKRCGL